MIYLFVMYMHVYTVHNLNIMGYQTTPKSSHPQVRAAYLKKKQNIICTLLAAIKLFWNLISCY